MGKYEPRPPVWTPEEKSRVAEMWNAGATCTAIGAAFGRSKNATIGIIHRLGLPPRGSPLGRTITAETKAQIRALATEGLSRGEIGRRVGVHPKTAARYFVDRPAKALAPSAPRPSPAFRVFDPAKIRLPRASAPRPQILPSGPRLTLIGTGPIPKTCQWPHGEPRTPGFHFCGAPSLPTRPYCPDHCAAAYVRLPLGNKEAAE